MDSTNNTFTLDELDAEFWESALFVKVQHSSGLGGWGDIEIITNEKIMYLICFATFPYDERKLEDFSDFFAVERYDKKKLRRIYKIEKRGWKFIDCRNVWIREEYYNKYIKEFEKARKKEECVLASDVFARALGVDGKIEIKRELELTKMIEKQCLEDELQKAERRKVELKKEHFTWKPMYMYNISRFPLMGEYAFLFKKDREEIRGYRFSIKYQYEETEPLSNKNDAPIEMYILFEKSYSHINGSLEYPNPDIPVKNIYTSSEITFDNAEINDCGKFVRAFQTLEDAKGYAVAIANTRQYANINNLYIPTKPK